MVSYVSPRANHFDLLLPVTLVSKRSVVNQSCREPAACILHTLISGAFTCDSHPLTQFVCSLLPEIACPPEDEVCVAVYQPVCGSDKKTYSNLCFFAKARCGNTASVPITLDHHGECKSGIIVLPKIGHSCFKLTTLT